MESKKEFTLPKIKINKRIQNKYLNELPFTSKKKYNSKIMNKSNSENKKEIIKEKKYPSNIIKKVIKNENNELISEDLDYSSLNQEYINTIKDNLNKELKLLVYNSFLLFNRNQLMKNIVKNPLSTKALEEKILLWKYYISNLSKEEKAKLMRKLFQYLEKFSKRCYDEFLRIKEVSRAYSLLKSKGKIYDNNDTFFQHKADYMFEFYMMDNSLGFDYDGNPLKEVSPVVERLNPMLFHITNALNITDELSGRGNGYVFLKELKEIGDMYSNSSAIFEYVFHDCEKIFDIKSFVDDKFQFIRIMWNFFSNRFIEDCFVITFMKQLKFLFGAYKDLDVVKFIQKLAVVKYNTLNILVDVKKQITDIIGPENEEEDLELDDVEKVEKMDNIDDIMKFIEEDNKPKKKKKKNKKNEMNDILNKYNEENKIVNSIKKNSNDEDIDDINDGLSIMSEDDNVLESFKNDILEETEYNKGNKITPILSSEFIEKFNH